MYMFNFKIKTITGKKTALENALKIIHTYRPEMNNGMKTSLQSPKILDLLPFPYMKKSRQVE